MFYLDATLFGISKSQSTSKSSAENSDDEITMVKQLFKSTRDKTPERSTSSPTMSASTQTPENISTENEHLKDSVQELLAQTQLLKSENQKLIKVVEERESETKTLRTKVSDLSSQKEKVESCLARSKADLKKATGQMLVHEEENKKLHTENDKLKKEKSDLVGQLAKLRGHSDSLDSKLEKISEEVEDKIEAEVADLKKVIMNELKDIKIQIDRSKFITSNNGDKGSANRTRQKFRPLSTPDQKPLFHLTRRKKDIPRS